MDRQPSKQDWCLIKEELILLEGRWMMEQQLLHGTKVYLSIEEPEVMAEAMVRWSGDSEYLRLLDAEPTNQYSVKKFTEILQKDQEKDPPPFYFFAIRTLEGDQLVGFAGLDGDAFPNGDIFVGIGIGDRELWGKGYGTDAMKVILRFGFQELNLRKVSLDTFEYNPRAIRSYEKAGFVHEGRVRKFLLREGKRWDLLFMGILREEWLARAG
jgi:RimJ/RimL family protein N-acetyltransferase